MNKTRSILCLAPLMAALLALSACGSGGSTQVLPDTQFEINESNLIDVFAIGSKARSDWMVFEQLPALIAMQVLGSGNTPVGSSPCPGGGSLNYQPGASPNDFSISFDKCKVNDLMLDSGSLQSKAVGNNGMDVDTVTKDLAISGASEALPLAPATYNASISRREGQAGQFGYSGSFSTLSKGKTDTIVLSSVYERVNLGAVLKQADATITTARFAQALKLSSQSSQVLAMSITSKDGSVLTITPKNDAFELTLRRNASSTPTLTQQVSGADLARALQGLY